GRAAAALTGRSWRRRSCEPLCVRSELRIERLEIADRPVAAGDRHDVALRLGEPELLVLERAHLGVVPIEARDVLLRFLRRDPELERQRARALARERREVDDFSEL